MELKKEVESLLFSSGKMMKEKELAELTNHSEKAIREALEALKKEYDERDTSLVFMNSGDSWKLNVREKYLSLVTKIVADTELPFPILETLGVIAYKAPAMQADLIKARGTNAYEHVGVLVEQGFVEKKKEGRSFRLSLTPKFFQYFEVAGHEEIKEALKDVKVPETQPEPVSKLEVVDLTPEEVKKEEEKEKKDKLGELEVVDALPEMPRETVETLKPDNEFLNTIDQKIEELSKKNDELDQDESFKRQAEINQELDFEKAEALPAEEEKAVEEEPEDEEGDEETEGSDEEDEGKSDEKKEQ